MPVSKAFTFSHLAAATTAVTNRFVTSANMKVGTYTLANSGAMPTAGARRVTVSHTQVGGVTDTLGTITVTGTDLTGATISEAIVPLSGTIATGTLYFLTVTSVVGAGWVVDAPSGEDTIVVGCEAGARLVSGVGVLHSVAVNTAAAGAVTFTDSSGTVAILKSSIAEGTYLYDLVFAGFLGITAAAATDLTVIHTATGAM